MEGRVVAVVAVVALADLQPDPERLGLGLRDDVLVVFPGAVRGAAIEGRLLVHVGAGISQHAPVELRAEPRHGEGRRAAGTAAHRRAGFRVAGELQVEFLFDLRQHLLLDELRVNVRHRVVFQAALAALGIAAAGVDQDRDHRRHALFVDQVVEHHRQHAAVAEAVLGDDERRGLLPIELRRDVDDHLAFVGHLALPALRDALVDPAVLGLHRELAQLALRHAVLRLRFGRVGVVGADDEVGLGGGGEGEGDPEQAGGPTEEGFHFPGSEVAPLVRSNQREKGSKHPRFHLIWVCSGESMGRQSGVIG